MFKKLLKDTFFYGASDLLFKVIAFLSFPIFAKHLTVEDYGTMSLVSVSVSIISIILNCGASNSLQRFFWEKDLIQEDLVISTFITLLISLVVGISAISFFAVFFSELSFVKSMGGAWIFQIALYSIFFDQMTQFFIDINRLNMKKMSFLLLSFSKNVLNVLLCIVFLVFLKKGLQGYFLGILFSGFFGFFIAINLNFKVLRGRVNIDIIKRNLSFGYPFIFTGLAYWLFGSLDRWMLANITSNYEVGLYSIAFKYASILIFISGAFSQAWSPLIIKYSMEESDYEKVVGYVFQVWCILLNLICIGLSFGAKFLVQLMTPVEYWPASSLVGITTLGVALMSTTQITAVGISLKGKTKIFTFVSWFAAALNFFLNLVLIPKLGAMGASVATLFANLFVTVMYFYFSAQLKPFAWSKGSVFFDLLIFVVCLFGIFFIPNSFYSLIAGFCLASIYIFILFFVNKSKIFSMIYFLRNE